MQKSIILAALLGVLASATIHAGTGSENSDLILSGPVENVDADSVTVLQHRIVARNAAAYSLQAGQSVSVYGNLQKDGSIANAVVEPSTSSYVAGADAVSLKGEVTTVDQAVGELQVGGTTIDYTPLLGNSNFEIPAVGDVIEISGSQPLASGLVLAGKIAKGATTEISQGGGVNRAISQGGGINRSISQGGGINRSISQGGGINRSISQGGGVNREISQGGGIDRAISQGGGINRQISQGGGINRS